MSTGERFKYVIFGGGAVGCPVGGLLVRAGYEVEFVARPAIAAALRGQVRVRQEGEEEFGFVAPAVTRVEELRARGNTIILITVKSQATREAIRDLASVYDRSVPVVCLQNGVRNEEIAAERFDNVYAGLVFFSSVHIEPDLITMPRGRTLAIGCYPSGLDRTAKQVCEDMTRAGLDVTASSYVMAMKWGKLVANLNNATHAITGYWLERGAADADMRRLMLKVREEGLRVLDEAGIAVEPPDDEPSPIRIRKMTEALRRPPKAPGQGERAARTYPSMWQDLYLDRRSHEADFLNGEIVELGSKLGMPTPYNSTLLELVNRMLSEGLKPGIYTPSELDAQVAARMREAQA